MSSLHIIWLPADASTEVSLPSWEWKHLEWIWAALWAHVKADIWTRRKRLNCSWTEERENKRGRRRRSQWEQDSEVMQIGGLFLSWAGYCVQFLSALTTAQLWSRCHSGSSHFQCSETHLKVRETSSFLLSLIQSPLTLLCLHHHLYCMKENFFRRLLILDVSMFACVSSASDIYSYSQKAHRKDLLTAGGFWVVIKGLRSSKMSGMWALSGLCMWKDKKGGKRQIRRADWARLVLCWILSCWSKRGLDTGLWLFQKLHCSRAKINMRLRFQSLYKYCTRLSWTVVPAAHTALQCECVNGYVTSLLSWPLLGVTRSLFLLLSTPTLTASVLQLTVASSWAEQSCQVHKLTVTLTTFDVTNIRS